MTSPWKTLEALAKRDNLRLFRTKGGVTIFTTDMLECPLVTITIGELAEPDDDECLRDLTGRALQFLKGINPE